MVRDESNKSFILNPLSFILKERFEDIVSVGKDEQREEHIDEGLKDVIASLKRKFKQVVNFLTGIVAKLTGSYWCPVDDDGQVLNAISPLTAGQAYKTFY